MAIITRPPRSVSDIKTHSGRASRDHQIYRDYFQVGALELERWRRTLERNVAASRIASIDSRITDIDKEKEELLTSAAAVCATIYNKGKPEEPTESKKPSGLRIKY
jgi:predicted nuclease with RNAse H fold